MNETAPLIKCSNKDGGKPVLGISADDISKSLTINTAGSSLFSRKIKSLSEPSAINSPALVSPPSSAFVSALQSPYISPRVTGNPLIAEASVSANSNHQSSKAVSLCDDIPSSSYTPPTDIYEYSDDPSDPKMRVFKDLENMPGAGRISFSLPAPRIVKGSVSPSMANAKLRSCDVYIGFHGQNPNLGRFCKWLKSELELQGIACFIADRAKYTDHQSHEIAERVISSVTHGVAVITASTFLNHFSVDEIRFFAQKRNLIPVWFDTDLHEIMEMVKRSSVDKECQEAIDGLAKSNEFKLEASDGNWRGCVVKAAGILRNRLGRKSAVQIETEGFRELPFPRNKHFIGRENELMEIEAAFFGCREHLDTGSSLQVTKGEASGQSEGLADEESDTAAPRWPVELFKRLKHKKSKGLNNNHNGTSSIMCINGAPGMGKTELALEFSYRYYQRYKMVFWVGGEARYFRQNLLNLSRYLGLDLCADPEKDRGRIRSYEEQEMEAFKRVKRELFCDMPYLLIIDKLESEKEWWEGKDLHDLIPRNTGGSHIIITTRLSKVMNYDMLQLPALSISEAMILIRGRRRREYSSDEVEFLRRFVEKLRRLSFGLWLVGSLLSELAISPSTLFRAISQVPLDEDAMDAHINTSDDQICRDNTFLMKAFCFCLAILQQKTRISDPHALRMLLVGAWFSPAPVSASLLAAAAESISETRNRFKKWRRCLRMVFYGGCLCQTWKNEEESALMLVKLGLARRANHQAGCWIQLNPIAQTFTKKRYGLAAAAAAVQGIRIFGNPVATSPHQWASVFLVFGYKIEPPLVQLQAIDMILFIKKTAIPLAINSFTAYSRCTSALELLKVCTNVVEEVEKSFASQIQDQCHDSLCWKKKLQSNQCVDEYVWQEVTFLKATLLETRAKLLLRGGYFDAGEELCRTCISIRTVMLGHNHPKTLAAQETLAKLVRQRSKM
uniref:Uncharacterized protein n=1 Tax=Kalanchoe fedtschenkoi TaxID=63787 RepID=A0A7N0SVT5_KALFE